MKKTTDHDNEKIRTIFVESLSDFVTGLVDFGPINSENKHFLFWYRGHANPKYILIPKIYRKAYSDISNQKYFWNTIREDEENYINDFRVRNYHLIDRFLENDLTWMSIMQHYGTPTRLLDWSENALSAFFFALEDYFSDEHKNEDVLPCIWCLKPKTLNELAKAKYNLNIDEKHLPDMFSLLQNTPTGKVNKSLDPNISAYYMGENYNKAETKCSECWPLAIIPPYNNERIRSQSGVFTLYPLTIGKQTDISLSSLGLENKPESNQFLRLFILLKPEKISLELKALGVKRSMFYPEMPSISYDIEQELNLHMR